MLCVRRTKAWIGGVAAAWQTFLVHPLAIGGDGWPSGAESPELIRDGGGLEVVLLMTWWLICLGWVVSSDRLVSDAVAKQQPVEIWSHLIVLPFPLVAVLAWWIPSPTAGILLMLLAWICPAIAYAWIRDRSVPVTDRMLTPAQLIQSVSSPLRRLGLKLPEITIEVKPTAASISLLPDASAGEESAARLRTAESSPGWKDALALLSEAVESQASALRLETIDGRSTVRLEMDGVWQPRREARVVKEDRKKIERWFEAPPGDREGAAKIRDPLMVLCGLKPSRKRPKQSAKLTMMVDGKPFDATIAWLAAADNDRLTVAWKPRRAVRKSLADVDLPESIAAEVRQCLQFETGLLLVAAPSESGCTTTFDLVVGSADRLIRNFVSIDDASCPERETQNVKPYRFDGLRVSAAAALEQALREYPNAIVTDRLEDPELAKKLVARGAEDQFIIAGVRATDAYEAVERLLALGAEREQLATSLVGILAQRLIRKLCPRCREEQPVKPEMLAKLGIDDGNGAIWAASKHGCSLCRGTGYRGRMAIFEFAGGEPLRAAVAAKADRKAFMKAVTNAGMRRLSKAGADVLATGATSLEELQRIFGKPAKS